MPIVHNIVRNCTHCTYATCQPRQPLGILVTLMISVRILLRCHFVVRAQHRISMGPESVPEPAPASAEKPLTYVRA